jgi:hypothetical protein
MADTYTTNLTLTKPEVGASADTWGTKLNTNADSIDALFAAGPYLLVASGGTGAGTAANARTNLGIGTVATQNADSITLTGGTIDVDSATVSGTEPPFWWYETDAATDEKNWRVVTSGGNWYLQAWNDAVTARTDPIVIARTGTVIDSIALAATGVTINGNAAYHVGNIYTAAINETQISDGTVLARVAANEIISGTWTFNNIIGYAGAGAYPHFGSSAQTSGVITVDTAAASGTPGNGDLWIQYTA